jgi:acetolactate synthase-1/2/3 large subunit
MREPIKGYQYIARTIAGYGITHVFYIEAMLRMVLRELDELSVKGIMAHTENAAGYMADGYARISGRPGVCMAQSIGTANLAGGINDAKLSNTPVIALTGKKSALYQYRNSYQEVDHRLLFESLTKFNADVTDSEQLPNLLRQCFREAVTGKPGPVHLDMPNHMGRITELATINEPIHIEESYKNYPAFRPEAEIDKVMEAAKIINEAKKPVIVVGRGATVSGAGDKILELAVKGDIPIVTSPDGKTVIDENNPIWAGIVGNYGMDCANKTVRDADLVIFVGTQTGDQTTLDWNVPTQNTKVIQIDIEASELGRNYPNSIGLLGDARAVTAQLVENINKSRHEEWRQKVQDYVNATMSDYKPYLMDDSTPIRPERLCHEISKVLPHDAVLVADTGYSAVWSATMIRMRPSQRYLRAAGSLGWAFPASLGVKCGAPEKPVICFTGDGAFYYHLSEMETAVKNEINTVTIINNNQILAQCSSDIDRIYEQNPCKGIERYTFKSVNFSKIAKEFGCYSERIERPEDIGPAINRALNSQKPSVIEVITDSKAIVHAPLK